MEEGLFFCHRPDGFPGRMLVLKAHFFARKTGLFVLLAATTLTAASVVKAETGTESASAASEAVYSSSQQTDQTQQPIVPRSVQERIRLRKQQRLDQQIQENYSHKYEAYVGIGYLRFRPGANLEKNNEREWVLDITRWYSQKWGVTVEGRGMYGTAYTGPNGAYTGTFLPNIYQYTGLIGGNYRFYRRPRIGAVLRVAAGPIYGNFDGDAHGITSAVFNASGVGLYETSTTFALNVAVPVDIAVTPSVAVRITPEYLLTPFKVTSSYPSGAGTQLQNNLGFNMGVVYRFGKR